MAGKWKFQQKRWSFFGFSHGGDTLMRTRELMCSGYGWVIDLQLRLHSGMVSQGGVGRGYGKVTLKKYVGGT